MTLVWADCVADTTTTTGTGAVTVSGTTSFLTGQTFSAVCSTNDTFYGRIAHQTLAEWEEGLYTYSGTNQVTRTTVLKSSNSNNAVNFSAGTKDVSLVLLSSIVAAFLRSDVADQTITGGANVTSLSQSTGNITVDCGARPLQYITNGGAFTITAPSNDGSCILLVTNNASAGAITFSGFSVGSNTGDALTTTNTNKFMITVVRINSVSTYSIKALQ